MDVIGVSQIPTRYYPRNETSDIASSGDTLLLRSIWLFPVGHVPTLIILHGERCL
jgi:hypothetical protein